MSASRAPVPAVAAAPPPMTPSPHTAPFTFTQGFILGQASFLLIVLLFMRYVVFSPADKGDEEGWRRKRVEREKKALLASRNVPPPPPSHILSKTEYEMATHPAESTDWLNVLFAQVMQGYRNDMLSSGGDEGAKLRVERWLNPENKRTSWLDPITVTSISLGNSYPLFTDARVRPADGQGRIRAEIDVEYNDSISLALSTSVLINFPRPRFAVLPVSLGVELVSIGGTLSVQIHDPQEGKQHLHACLLPDFHLNLKTTTLLGSRAKLQDVPKLEQLILSRMRSAIQDRFVYPHTFSLSLPRLLNPASSASAQPFIDDLGESAVEAMGQAVKEGFGRMVSDLGLDISDPTAEESGGITRTNSIGERMGEAKTASASAGTGAVPTAGAGIPRSAGVDVKANGTGTGSRGKRIPMPAGFPYSNPTSSDRTPLVTPGGAGGGGGAGLGPTRGMSSGMSSARVPTLASASASGEVGAGEGSQFRFRGQFAGAADASAEGAAGAVNGAAGVGSGLGSGSGTTPGEGRRSNGTPAGLDEARRMMSSVGVNGAEGRRVGVLNSSRA